MLAFLQRFDPKIPVTAGLITGIFLVALESTVVATAMPSVIKSLGGEHLYSLPFAVYMLSSTLAGPILGRLSDLYGRRRFYLASVAIFVLGSVLCGAATSMPWLVVARVVQGVGAGGVMPLTLASIASMYPLEQRAQVQGFISGVWGVSGLLGPLVGGLIADHLSWRWVFFISTPFALIAAMLVSSFYRDEDARRETSVDWLGAGLFGLGTGLVIWALEAHDARFALTGLPVLAWFALVQARVRDPLLPLSVFRSRLVTLGILGNGFAAMAYFGLIAYLPLYVQRAAGTGATAAGAVLTPMIVAWTVSAIIASRLLVRLGPRTLTLLGSSLLVVGFTAFRLALGGPLWVLSSLGLLIGLGMGFTMLTLLITVQSAVPKTELGVVTGSVLFARTVGGSVGTAAMGALIGAGLEPGTGVAIAELTAGIGRAFLLALALASATWLVALALPRPAASTATD